MGEEMNGDHSWLGNDREFYRFATDGTLRPVKIATSPICLRCLVPNRVTHRAVSDEMDIPICFNCALEAWRYTGPLGRITLEVIR